MSSKVIWFDLPHFVWSEPNPIGTTGFPFGIIRWSRWVHKSRILFQGAAFLTLLLVLDTRSRTFTGSGGRSIPVSFVSNGPADGHLGPTYKGTGRQPKIYG